MFRSAAANPRNLLPPSAFPTGLQPVGPNDLKGVSLRERRVSRTDMDFEQALHASGTVVLQESVDVNSLGMDLSFSMPTPPPKSAQTPRAVRQPSTPTVVPPTPTPASSSSARLGSPSPSSSSGDLFFDAEDSDIQTKRRSIYRSPGTASSPDLATLLRKAKERGGVVNAHHLQEKRRDHPPPPPLPKANENLTVTSRPRSSTTVQPPPDTVLLTPSGKLKLRSPTSPASPSVSEWILPSPKLRTQEKPPKTSVRAKTSAFLGKMLGSGTIKVKDPSPLSVESPSKYASPAIYEAFATTPALPPPVPIVLEESSSLPPKPRISDVFNISNSPDMAKPLPPIANPTATSDNDDQSMVFVEKPSIRSLSPEDVPRVRTPDPAKRNNTNHTKRRSMSVGEVELKKAMESSSTSIPLPRGKESLGRKDVFGDVCEKAVDGVLDDFKGELQQLDPLFISPLKLKDPSTPARKLAAASRTVPDWSTPPKGGRAYNTEDEEEAEDDSPLRPFNSRAQSDGSPSIPVTVGLGDTAVPPRSSSLRTPLRFRTGLMQSSPRTPIPTRQSTSPRQRNSYQPSSPTHVHSLSRESVRLRALHKSSASSSEPSLIPTGDDNRLFAPTFTLIAQHESGASEPALSTMSSRAASAISNDSPDIESKGKDLATRCWAEDEEFLAKEKISEWLGGQAKINKLTLKYYMCNFDFTGLRLDVAFRRLCAKLFLKGETQQVDRILDEFSKRYWECNSGGLYGSASVVHSVSYSLLLLNTDLHVADLATRMSRTQFVKNTLQTIQMHVNSPSSTLCRTSESNRSDGASDSTETMTRSKRSDSVTSWNSISKEMAASTTTLSSSGPLTNQLSPHNGSTLSIPGSQTTPTPSINGTSTPVYDRNWENDMEGLLKEMYNAIKSQQILQPLNTAFRTSTSSLSPSQGMARNRSTRGPPDRLMTLKRGSIRGLQSIMGAQQGVSPYSSNSSIDGRVSPALSFATTHDALYGSSSSFLAPALGFASNLSHTIIREALEDDRSTQSEESGSTTISITDEELALLGAPWAKEGMLCRKQYWESTGKRARDKGWLDVFVVIQKGELNMFVFGDHAGGGSGIVGGGNWLENADLVGTVLLTHSLAHALPPPGYNRQRPHCMVLTLSNGGVYFFQAGTEELVNEWVSTCNYWAARTSKQPLTGGVSNMEYGWNHLIDSPAHGRSLSDGGSKDDQQDSLSVKSGKSARSKFNWKDGAATMRAAQSPWSDRTHIHDWKPPQPPTIASGYDEETQMEALQKHVSTMKKDLKKHNEYREPMSAVFPPRSTNATKSMSNWEKKSQYLLTEIVKYDSYIESLQAAMALRLKKRGEKALDRALQNEEGLPGKGKWKGPEGETIPESEEPPLTPVPLQQTNSQRHRRETAEAG